MGNLVEPGKALTFHAVGLGRPAYTFMQLVLDWPGKALPFSCSWSGKAVLLAWLPGPTYTTLSCWLGRPAIREGWGYWPGKALLLAWLPCQKIKQVKKVKNIHQSHQLQVVSPLQEGGRKVACSICSTKALRLKSIRAPKHGGTLLLCHFQPQRTSNSSCFQTSV